MATSLNDQWGAPYIPTPWETAFAEIRTLFAASIGQAVVVSGTNWAVGRNKAGSKFGWVDAVVANGWVFARQAKGAWGQEEPVIVRIFVGWKDLWAEADRTTVQGSWTGTNEEQNSVIDIGLWMSEWNARGRTAQPAGKVPNKLKATLDVASLLLNLNEALTIP